MIEFVLGIAVQGTVKTTLNATIPKIERQSNKASFEVNTLSSLLAFFVLSTQSVLFALITEISIEFITSKLVRQ